MQLKRRRENVPVGKIREDFRGELPSGMGFKGWVNVQKTQVGGAKGPAWAEPQESVGYIEGPVRCPCKLCVRDRISKRGRVEPEDLNAQANTAFSLFFQHQNREVFEPGMTWWLTMIKNTRMQIYYILNLAKQIVWDGYHHGCSFGKHSYSAGVWRSVT